RTVTLDGVPASLAAALDRRAGANSLTVSEFAIEQLAAAAWHWDQPCRHDLRERSDPWRHGQPLYSPEQSHYPYDDPYGEPGVIPL
ncbi:MAG: hypothetical protein ACRDVZ_15205, partial [Jiangellaceae bacterium]